MICSLCGADTVGRTLCAACTRRAFLALGALHALLIPLTEAVVRQSQFGQSDRVRTSRSAPLPYDEKASDVSRVLVRWVLGRGADLGIHADPLTIGRVLSAFLRRIDLIAQVPDAGDIVREAEALVIQIESAIDRPPPRISLGLHECGRPVRTSQDDIWFSCGCGSVIEIAAHRKQLLRDAKGLLLNATEMAFALSTLGEPINATRIRKWAERKRLVAHATDTRNRPLYRVDDVLVLLKEHAA